MALIGFASVARGDAVGRKIVVVLIGLITLAGIAGCSLLGGDQGPEFLNWEPELSPDGTQIVYESRVGETLDLFIRDASTGVEMRLTTNEFDDWSPSWSPESDRIAFASSREKNADIYIVTVDTLEVTRLTTDTADDINPSWGVDGRIYFNSNRADAWEIYVMDPDGTNLTKITGIEPIETP